MFSRQRFLGDARAFFVNGQCASRSFLETLIDSSGYQKNYEKVLRIVSSLVRGRKVRSHESNPKCSETPRWLLYTCSDSPISCRLGNPHTHHHGPGTKLWRR